MEEMDLFLHRTLNSGLQQTPKTTFFCFMVLWIEILTLCVLKDEPYHNHTHQPSLVATTHRLNH